MIRIQESSSYFDGKQYIEGACLSTDTKPTGLLATGSVLIEVDTGDVYMYNEAASAWVKQCSLQG